MTEERTIQNGTGRGGRRMNAGRPRSKVRRRKVTIWASEEEIQKIREFLLQNRANDSE